MRLLDAAEGEGRRRGCDPIVLATFTSQAPDFYRRHGFTVCATIENHPRRHRSLLPRQSIR